MLIIEEYFVTLLRLWHKSDKCQNIQLINRCKGENEIYRAKLSD